MSPRPAIGTRERILRAAVEEFSQQGYRGGRVQRIASRARANLRMIYHYFGDKEALYQASLERVYLDLRGAEEALNLAQADPVKGMRRFVEYTFEHFLRHPEFAGMLSSENQLGAKYLRRSSLGPQLSPPLKPIAELLDHGAREGVFRSGVDPMQFFLTLHALCYLHQANRNTLSVMLQADVTNRKWLDARKRHVLEVVFAYLRPDVRPSSRASTRRVTRKRGKSSP